MDDKLDGDRQAHGEHPGAASHRKVTIRDVAEAAGVASSTVSRAFARPGRVSASTARHIHEVADRIGYRTTSVSPFADSDQLNGLIAIVVADLSNPVFAEYTRSAQHECLKHGLGLLVIDSEENMIIERNAIRAAISHIDGIILASSRLSDAGIRKLAEIKPVVALNRSIRGIQSVIADTTDGLTMAVQHLYEMGHRSITYLGGPESSWQDGMRWRILSTLCSRQGIKLRRVTSTAPTFSGGYRCRSAFEDNPSTAVIAYNDIMAIGFIASLHAQGIAVPDQVSVVGIDDVQVSSLVSPAISTVRLPRKQLGAFAVDEMSAMLRHTKPSNSLKPVIVQSDFIMRTSTGRAPTQPISAGRKRTRHSGSA